MWDHSRARREQAGWSEHAAFMDALAEEGFVVLGGPIGEGDGENGCWWWTRTARRRSATAWPMTLGQTMC